MLRFLIVFLLAFSLQLPALAQQSAALNVLVINDAYFLEKYPIITNGFNHKFYFQGSYVRCGNPGLIDAYAVYRYQRDNLDYGYNINVGYTEAGQRKSFYFVLNGRLPWSDYSQKIGQVYDCESPPACITVGFPACVGAQIITRFPFDIFLNIPAASINCPTVEFFEHVYDICWLYELMRWLKYPMALSLLIKLAMQL